MKTPIRLAVISAVVLLVTVSGTYKKASSGAPIGSTGAPGENTCAKSGCHDDNGNLNSGSGILALQVENAAESYVPGEVYSMEVNLKETGIVRFGFSLSARNAKGEMVGTLIVTDSQRTQVLKGAGPYTGMEYMTYKFPGTAAYSKDQGKWAFQWKAPQVASGPVRFYFAAVSANNDGTDGGDKVYTASKVLEAAPMAVASINKITALQVFPNPVRAHFTLRYTVVSQQKISVQLYDMRGRQLQTLWEGYASPGEQTLYLERPPLPGGVYLLKVKSKEAVHSHKITLE